MVGRRQIRALPSADQARPPHNGMARRRHSPPNRDGRAMSHAQSQNRRSADQNPSRLYNRRSISSLGRSQTHDSGVDQSRFALHQRRSPDPHSWLRIAVFPSKAAELEKTTMQTRSALLPEVPRTTMPGGWNVGFSAPIHCLWQPKRNLRGLRHVHLSARIPREYQCRDNRMRSGISAGPATHK